MKSHLKPSYIGMTEIDLGVFFRLFKKVILYCDNLQNLMCKIRHYNFDIALKFCYVCSAAAKPLVILEIDTTILTHNLAASRVCEILRQYLFVASLSGLNSNGTDCVRGASWSTSPSSHCWGYSPGTWPCSQVSATHLEIGRP